MSGPRVSVIIPAYNSAAYLRDAIDSALNQTHAPGEVIVVNDGSTDNTEALLESYGDRIVVVAQSNAGLPSARNAGMRIARGDWLAFLDADDAWHPYKLELQLAAAARQPQLGLIGTGTYQHPLETPPPNTSKVEPHVVPLERLLVRNYFTASSVIVRRDVAERAGEFDPPLPNAEDWDFWQRCGEWTTLANLRLPLTGYREVPGSLSRRPAAMERGIRLVLNKLDRRDAWGGRRWLRARSVAHLHYSMAFLQSAAGRPIVALRHIAQSMAAYPLPFNRDEVAAPFARPRRAAVLALRALGLAPLDSGLNSARGHA